MSIVSDILKKLEPEERTFDVFLPAGLKLKFRHFIDGNEYAGIKADIPAFVKMVKGKSCPEAYASIKLKDPEQIGFCLILERIHADEERSSSAEWMQLAKELPLVFEHVTTIVNMHLGRGAIEADVEEVVEAKKD